MAEKVDTSLDAVDDMVAFMHKRVEGTWVHADAIHVAALLYALQAKLEEAQRERDAAKAWHNDMEAEIQDLQADRDAAEARALPPGKIQSALVALNWLEVHSTTDMPGAKAAWATIRAALPTQETEG